MAGGQAISTAQGTLVALGGDGNQALTGAESTSARGTTGITDFVPLRSRKVGGGTASAGLTGAASTGTLGTLTYSRGFTLTGQSRTLAQGTLTYFGRAILNWNVNTEPDLAGYKVKHGTVSGTYPDIVTLGLVTTYQWNGLAPHTTHFFVISAYDTSLNESGNSAEVSKTF